MVSLILNLKDDEAETLQFSGWLILVRNNIFFLNVNTIL